MFSRPVADNRACFLAAEQLIDTAHFSRWQLMDRVSINEFNVMYKEHPPPTPRKKSFECTMTPPKLIPVIECACGLFFVPSVLLSGSHWFHLKLRITDFVSAVFIVDWLTLSTRRTFLWSQYQHSSGGTGPEELYTPPHPPPSPVPPPVHA